MNIKLIIGLGNPGKKYESTRHNLGRSIIQAWRKQAGFSDFKEKKKMQALVSEDKFQKEKVVLALPETFMNSSGQSIKLIVKNYKIKPDSVVVVHDDFDLDLGKIKISKDRGSGGHKGIQSIINQLKTKSFVRFRIGIKPKRKSKDLDKFVLKKFSRTEQLIIKKIIKKTLEAISFYMENDLEKAMNEFNKE
ncbi:MAG: aminoacyl-tRNA hydrolase [Patescibacteria group bacterium]|nr:aminoacyl-tRNA hydrolase [Patescibacteria group bacterium]